MEKTNHKTFTFTRVFNAPREVVFKSWVDEKKMAQWWGPDTFTNPVCKLDVRPGGAIRIEMKGPDGVVYPMAGEFHDIREPELIVFTSTAFEDDNGNPQLEVLNTVTFEDYEGNTKVTTQAQIIKATGDASQSVAGMEEGWNQSFARLSNLVEK